MEQALKRHIQKGDGILLMVVVVGDMGASQQPAAKEHHDSNEIVRQLKLKAWVICALKLPDILLESFSTVREY